MPRDNDKNNDSRGRRDRPSGGKGRSGAARGPEKKFAKRGFAGKERRPQQARWRAASLCRQADAPSPDGDKPYRQEALFGLRASRYAGKREGAAAASFNAGPIAAPRGEKRPYTPRERSRRCPPGRAVCRPEIRRQETLRIAGWRRRETALYAARRRLPQGRRPARRAIGPYHAPGRRATATAPQDRPERKFGGDKKFSRGAPDRSGPAQGFRQPGSQQRSAAIAAIQSRGRSAMRLRPITSDAIPVRRATVREVRQAAFRQAAL